MLTRRKLLASIGASAAAAALPAAIDPLRRYVRPERYLAEGGWRVTGSLEVLFEDSELLQCMLRSAFSMENEVRAELGLPPVTAPRVTESREYVSPRSLGASERRLIEEARYGCDKANRESGTPAQQDGA